MGLPVAKHETVTSEPDAGWTDALISDIPENKKSFNIKVQRQTYCQPHHGNLLFYMVAFHMNL